MLSVLIFVPNSAFRVLYSAVFLFNYNIQDLDYITMRSEIVVQTNQPVTVEIVQTNDDIQQTSTVPIVSTNINLFGSY